MMPPSMQLFLWTFVATLLAVHVAADTIDNGLTQDPTVTCLADRMSISFSTRKEFEGHVYVRGHYSTDQCKSDATLDTITNLTVNFADCDVRKRRANNPRGIFMSATVIITFHPMFITKIDKSYNVQCFYKEADRHVSQNLDVGSLQTEVLTQSLPLPTCSYRVLEDGPKGAPVRFAKVGQTVYHQWSCALDPASAKQMDRLYCATVHSCVVREESGREVQLLDENGCSVDKFLLNNLDYTSDLTGGQLSQVFKFADQASLFFQCQVRLSLKEDAECKRSSDDCPISARGKREAVESDGSSGDGQHQQDVDVFSQSMTVFDIEEPITSTSARELNSAASDSQAWHSDGRLCLSPHSFAALLAVLVSMLLLSSTLLVLFCFRPHAIKLRMNRGVPSHASFKSTSAASLTNH